MRIPFTVLAVLCCAKIWALDCSILHTLSDPSYDAFDSIVCANQDGDVAVLWEIRDQRENETIAGAYKIKSSTWSSPEIILEWNEYISYKTSFINSKGDLFAVWKGQYTNPFRTAEKKLGESWTPPLNMFADNDFTNAHIAFDSLGKIICAVEQKIKTIIPPHNSWGASREVDVPALEIATWSQDGIKQDEDVFLGIGGYPISRKTIASNQNGLTHIFWFSHSSNGIVLMGRKMQNSQFISKAETIYHEIPTVYISGFKSSINEKEDVALAWGDDNHNIKILTNLDGIWSKPHTITTEANYSDIQVSIDNSGNIVTVYTSEVNGLECLVAVYKPYGQPWMDPVQFSDLHQINQYPQIKHDFKGNFVLIWEKSRKIVTPSME